MREERTSSALPPTSGTHGLTPAERTLRARLAAHAMHARHDARQTTLAARVAFLGRFETLAERRRRAEHARRAYFTRLALASAKARRVRRQSGGGARA